MATSSKQLADQVSAIDLNNDGVRVLARRLVLRRHLRRWIATRLHDIQSKEAERTVLWLPFGFALGAGFTCSAGAADPSLGWLLATLVALILWLILLALAERQRRSMVQIILSSLAMSVLLAAATFGGGAAALLRARAVAAPIVVDQTKPMLASGIVSGIDKSQSGAWRATMEVTSIDHLAPALWPVRIRISLKQDEPPIIGTTLACQSVLRTPPGPVVPGAYDFARKAWFAQIGAVGFATKPCKPAKSPAMQDKVLSIRFAVWLAKMRAMAARSIIEKAPGPGGAFLAAITTGDRSWFAQEDLDALQIAGLSHIISVSGLHVGLLGGLVFLVVWKLVALVPRIALYSDGRKIAAWVAGVCVIAYTIFTGSEAPAVRACIMTCIAFGAILFNRKAISMRGLAIAAVAVLMARPESAIDPGFQMSFLATSALVALWEVWETRFEGEPKPGLIRKVALWFSAAALTSFVAGLATAPVAASTFGRVSLWALPANLLVAPINDFIVGPSAILAAALSPFGLDTPFWRASAWGLGMTLKVAHFFSELPGANATLPWTRGTAPLLLIFAVFWLTLWRSWMRYLSALPVLLGLIVWALSPTPVGWISPAGKAILATPQMNAPSLCRTSGGRFDSARLLDQARLDNAIARQLMPPSQHFYKRACFLGEGDWEGRYIEVGRGRAVLALSLNGKTYGIGRYDLPDGGLILRHGWQLKFEDAPKRIGPWAHAEKADPIDINDLGSALSNAEQ
jgi:competence protein ComEC